MTRPGVILRGRGRLITIRRIVDAMADEIEQLFVREVEIGIGNLNAATPDGVITDKVVVERATATDHRTGEDRELLLVYGAAEVPAVADALRQAAQRAMAEQS